MKPSYIHSLTIQSLTAALYVTVTLFFGAVSHWSGLFLLPLSIILGFPFAVGMGIGTFISTFIMPRDPLVLISAVVGAASNLIASTVCYFVYKHLRLKNENLRIQIPCLLASILTMFIDGTRTILSWWAVGIKWPIYYVWLLTFSYSFFMINIFGFIILIEVKKLLTTSELKRRLDVWSK
jgi:hypothetical protein